MSVSELRKKNVEELNQELLALLKEQFNLRIQKGLGQPLKPHLLKHVKKAIARVKTLLDEKGRNV